MDALKSHFWHLSICEKINMFTVSDQQGIQLE